MEAIQEPAIQTFLERSYVRIWLSVWIATILFVGFLSLWPGAPPPPTELPLDKLNHLLAYFVLAVQPAMMLRKRSTALLACAGMAGYGALLEGLQSFIDGRYAGQADMAANLIGVGLGYVLGRIACS